MRCVKSRRAVFDTVRLTEESRENMKLDEKERANLPRWDGRRRGWYEVYFLKFNVPGESTALWLRYTLTSPLTRIGLPYCELWGAFFDSDDPSRKFAIKKRYPIEALALDRQSFGVGIGRANLEMNACHGEIASGGHRLFWNLRFDSRTPVLYHLPYRWLYRTVFPRTKAACPHLDAGFSGVLKVDGREIVVSDAPGQQEHVWGTRHNLRWAWGHCNNFREDPSAVWEGADCQVRHGPFASAHFKMVYLKTRDREYRFNAPLQWLVNRSSWETGSWQFEARDKRIRVVGEVSCRLEDLIGVTYVDPDGEQLFCNNTKVASIRLRLFSPGGQALDELSSERGAAVEFADRKRDPRVPVLV